jgi:hypothetical protein
MEQIAVEAEYFNLLPSGGWMPDFVGTFFVDSNAKVSLNHEVLVLNSAELSFWNRMGKSKTGVQGVNFFISGESFLIINDDALTLAIPFFEKHLADKFRAL